MTNQWTTVIRHCNKYLSINKDTWSQSIKTSLSFQRLYQQNWFIDDKKRGMKYATDVTNTLIRRVTAKIYRQVITPHHHQIALIRFCPRRHGADHRVGGACWPAGPHLEPGPSSPQEPIPGEATSSSCSLNQYREEVLVFERWARDLLDWTVILPNTTTT